MQRTAEVIEALAMVESRKLSPAYFDAINASPKAAENADHANRMALMEAEVLARHRARRRRG